MIQVKNKIVKASILALLSLIIVSFKYKPFVLDGGIINNPDIIITGNTTPPEIIATNASGCEAAITYQWQQSYNAIDFIDVPNATNACYQAGIVINTTHFRRRTICSGSDTAYTSNVATIMIQ